ncbi:MAG: excisionase family DNA-binding protein [Bacteroidetes bacterium]|nr:excisionase family DNA-binding protein [Bacteroidota bacterium]
MTEIDEIKRPTKEEQELALRSYETLSATLEELHSKDPEIEIEETEEKIRVPLSALRLLAKILKATSQGKPISIVPHATEMTTQSAAEMLGCSRPHVIKLLESGAIAFTKVGRHRRIKLEDILSFKSKMKAEQKDRLIQMMREDEEKGLYDS